MSAVQQAFLTATLTILGGVIVFVVSQLVLKFLIEPIQEQRKVIGQIADALIFYANVSPHPAASTKDRVQEAEISLRKLSSSLLSTTYVIPNYTMLESIRVVPRISDILVASRELIGLSNSVYSDSIDGKGNNRSRKIRKALGIRTDFE